VWPLRNRPALVSLAIGAIGILAACSTTRPGTTGSTVPSTTKPLNSYGLAPADLRFTDHIELSRDRAPAGQSISGDLVVTSKAAAAINLTSQCRPQFEVVINNAAITQRPVFTRMCSNGPLIIKPGINRFPITVVTSYFECVQAGVSSVSSIPECTASGSPPPLPPGVYHTTLVGSGATPLPEPASVRVTVT
jgi:hypothetical protein